MQIKHIFSIGLNDKDTKKQIFTIKQAQQRVINILIQHKTINGYTIHQAKGGYKHIDNTFINENSLILELFDKLSHKFIKTLINDLKSIECLNQESIAYTKQKVRTLFY